MTITELIMLWQQQFKHINLHYVYEQITKYAFLLLQANQKQNLTRLTTNLYQQYFYQSVLNFQTSDFNQSNLRILDIGSGSGIPGVVLKILFPTINLYLLEANNKKCHFLTHLVKFLQLNKTIIINQRCELFIKTKRNFFDLATARAVAPLRILLEYAIPGLCLGGKCLFLKSQNFQQEINDAWLICHKLKLHSPQIRIKKDDNKSFVMLVYTKKQNNSLLFPRSYPKIKVNHQK